MSARARSQRSRCWPPRSRSPCAARAPLAALGRRRYGRGSRQALAGGSLSQSVAAFVAVLCPRLLRREPPRAPAGSPPRASRSPLAGAWGQTLVETARPEPFDHESGDYVFVALLIGAAWLGGFALRGRAHRIAGLEHEAAARARARGASGARPSPRSARASRASCTTSSRTASA